MFLKAQGLRTAAEARTLSKSVCFFGHLVSRLHSILKTRYLVGRELTTLQIKDAHNPYLGNSHKEHGENLVECKKHGDSLLDVSKKLKAMDRMVEIGTDGQLPPNTRYLIDIGMEMDQIKLMARRCPRFAGYSLERNIKPFVEFLLDLGVPPSDIPRIIYRMPQLCGISLSENIIPSMAYFETLGLDKNHWAKVIRHHPPLLALSRQNVKATVDYLYEVGLSKNKIGKVLTRFPHITGCSVDGNLRPTAEYFDSMGVNLKSLFSNSPQVLCQSIECKLKPVTEFFLDKGYTVDEIGTMASKYGTMYCLSLTENLIPKWDFFLTMGYPRSELLKYPYYFGFSLEGRIKPRYSLARKCSVELSFRQLLVQSDEFEILLNKSMKKVLDARCNF